MDGITGGTRPLELLGSHQKEQKGARSQRLPSARQIRIEAEFQVSVHQLLVLLRIC